jgi:hypothetical protein
MFCPIRFKRILDKADAQQLDVFYLNFEIFDAHGKSVWQTNFTQLEDKIFDGVSGYYAPRGYPMVATRTVVGYLIPQGNARKVQFEISQRCSIP